MREVVLLEGIELSTSPLPRECSTTELQQRRPAYTLARAHDASRRCACTSPPRLTRPVQECPDAAMPEPDPKPAATPPAQADAEARRRREADALRENLRRCKEQARARQVPAPEADPIPDVRPPPNA